MVTIDETIKVFEDFAIESEDRITHLTSNDYISPYEESLCLERAEKYRQFVAWFKELKELRIKVNCIKEVLNNKYLLDENKLRVIMEVFSEAKMIEPQENEDMEETNKDNWFDEMEDAEAEKEYEEWVESLDKREN